MRFAALMMVSFLVLAAGSSTVTFRQVAPSGSGISWVHDNGKSSQRFLPETTGAGVALFDFNNDGWIDIFLVNSGRSRFYIPSRPLRHALYRNNANGTFSDVTREAGITADFFGMGTATGDYDGDGFTDLYLSGYEKCFLYHNNGNNSFTDVTAASGLGDCRWGTSAVWFDYDNDSKLDLFVGEFADYSELRKCSISESYGGGTAPSSEQSYYCNPKLFRPVPSRLFRNLGGGRFADASRSTGILSRAGKAWGVVATDINGDRHMDLFVANDTMPNFLWVNRGGEKFEEIALEAGVAYGADGQARSGMGVDAADFDNDGRQDLIVANIDAQMTSLYRGAGDETFEDVNLQTGVGQATRMLSGWGLRFVDYDNDGWLDLILSNGHPDDLIDQRIRGITYQQPILLLRNQLGLKMQNVSVSAGSAFSAKYSARGLAAGDLNNDGYADVLFTENGGPPHMLINSAAVRNNWFGLQLQAKTSNPAAAGAIIKWSVSGKVFTRVKNAGGSYLSGQDSREVLGAGIGRVDWVEVHWPPPSRQIDRITSPPMNQYVTLVEGQTSGAIEGGR